MATQQRLLDKKEYRKNKAATPRFLRIKLTDRCNMSCHMCGQQRFQKINRASIIPKSRELSLHQWKNFIEHLPYKNLSFFIWGGEPFLSKNAIKLIRIIKNKGHLKWIKSWRTL